MTDLFLYIVAASQNPDFITCSVPHKINENEIFFGPCKKKLRELLRSTYLGPKLRTTTIKKPIFVVGVNGGNKLKMRKVVWAGRIKKIMTYEWAYHNLSSKRYEKMRNSEWSPLLVEPLYRNKRFRGYKHRSKLHAPNDGWISDLVTERTIDNIQIKSNQILLKKSKSYFETFKRDCCITIHNIFYACGTGIQFDSEALKILRKLQPKRKIDKYAIFGYRKDGSADGKTGSFLHMKGPTSKQFINWIIQKASETKLKGDPAHAFTRTLCKPAKSSRPTF